MFVRNFLNGRRYLVAIRCGPNSVFLDWWKQETGERNYDLIVLPFAYKDLPAFDAEFEGVKVDAVYLDLDPSIRKWSAVSRLLKSDPSLLEYDAVWFPDDDLVVPPGTVSRLFDMFVAAQGWLGQPALHLNSYFSFFITLQNRNFDFRQTNFVEIMCPVMSKECLKECLPTFTESRSGWGLDYLWANRARTLGKLLFIFDALPVLHGRPIGQSGVYEGLGVSPWKEYEHVLGQFGIAAPEPAVISGRTSGKEWIASNRPSARHTLSMLCALASGYPVRTMFRYFSGYRQLIRGSFFAHWEMRRSGDGR